MARLCTCDRCDTTPDTPYSLDQCRLCWLYYHDDGYKELAKLPIAHNDARHQNKVVLTSGVGTEVANIISSLQLKEDCSSCKGWIAQMNHWGPAGCKEHREEILARLRAQAKKLGWFDRQKARIMALATGLAFKLDIRDPAAGILDEAIRRVQSKPIEPLFEKILTRNLLYHIAPFHRSTWKHNIHELLQRWQLFNGQRVIAIVTGSEFISPAEVKDVFPKDGTRFLEIPNNPARREVETFLPLFESVNSTDEHTATFYAHAKGVTRPRGHTAHMWAKILYETCLDYWPFVSRLLQSFPIAGSLKKRGMGWPEHESKSQWHYSGSFFWFRNDALFSKPAWRTIDQFWSGIESYPSLHFTVEEAGCIFHENTVPQLNMYSNARISEPTGWRYIAEVLQPELAAWYQQHTQDRTNGSIPGNQNS